MILSCTQRLLSSDCCTNELCAGQQLWEIQEGRFGSPVPPDVISILATELGITTDLIEYEKILRLHNVSIRTCFAQKTFIHAICFNIFDTLIYNAMIFCVVVLKIIFYKYVPIMLHFFIF